MILVAVGIIIRNSSVLLCQRRSTARYGLKWEFPGGKIEDNEHAEDCLRRELEEELGITVEIDRSYHRQSFQYPDSGSFDVSYYMIRKFVGELVNRVFETIRWVPVGELLNYDILEGNRDVVEKLVQEYGNAVPAK
jgi:8-oxo-dGTP diphosphatase